MCKCEWIWSKDRRQWSKDRQLGDKQRFNKKRPVLTAPPYCCLNPCVESHSVAPPAVVELDCFFYVLPWMLQCRQMDQKFPYHCCSALVHPNPLSFHCQSHWPRNCPQCFVNFATVSLFFVSTFPPCVHVVLGTTFQILYWIGLAPCPLRYEFAARSFSNHSSVCQNETERKKKHQRTTTKKEHKRSKQSTKQFCSFVVVVVEAPNPKRNVPNSTVTTAHFRCGRIQFFQCFLLFQMLWWPTTFTGLSHLIANDCWRKFEWKKQVLDWKYQGNMYNTPRKDHHHRT